MNNNSPDIQGGDADLRPIKPLTYFWISLTLLGLTVVGFVLLTATVDLLPREWSDRGFYIVLFPLSFAAGAFLFGAMRSFANWKGRVMNGNLELAGPVVLAVAILIGGFLIPKNTPFSFSIYLSPNLNVSNDYPPLKDAYLEFFQDGWTRVEVDKSNVATLKNLNPDLEGKTLRVRLQSEHWRLTGNSLTFSSKSKEIEIIPNGSLGRLVGTVRDAISKIPISGYIGEIDEEDIVTNSKGAFLIIMPIGKQKEQYTLKATKTGYLTEQFTVFPKSTPIGLDLTPIGR